MKFMLFSTALFQVLLGVALYGWIGVLCVQSVQGHPNSAADWVWLLLYAVPGACLLTGLGGIQGALTRLAYPPARRASPEPAVAPVAGQPPPVPIDRPRVRRRLMERVLGVMALSQLGAGLIVFACGSFIVFREGPRLRAESFAQVWLVTVSSWVLASLGGILWALTRIAYPPPQRSPAGPPPGGSDPRA
jgi:hypothetical protein